LHKAITIIIIAPFLSISLWCVVKRVEIPHTMKTNRTAAADSGNLNDKLAVRKVKKKVCHCHEGNLLPLARSLH
jgi:hypothetical protein